MSKMNDIALQLDERAVELGFADHLEALGNGYEWGIKDNGEAFLFNPKDEQEKAHEAWLEQKSQLLTRLTQLEIYLSDKVEHGHFLGKDDWEVVADAIDFIERGEM